MSEKSGNHNYAGYYITSVLKVAEAEEYEKLMGNPVRAIFKKMHHWVTLALAYNISYMTAHFLFHLFLAKMKHG